MSKLAWDPTQTRDVQEDDQCGVVVQRQNVLFRIQDQWQDIPAEFWTWTFVVQTEKDGFVPSQLAQPRSHRFDRFGLWLPKPLPSTNDTSLWNQIDAEALPSQPTLPLASRRRPADRKREIELPPELFEHICGHADGRSASFRLVNKFWYQQCSRLVFPQISLKQSPQRLRRFSELRRDPACLFALHVKSFTPPTVPSYTSEAEFPFLHLLGQINVSVHEPVIIRGPFPCTIRSIHFDVPRSLPPSFSRGMKHIRLRLVRLRRFEDLSHLASELPDLTTLECSSIRFGSFPTGPPRRRPRKSRNRLEKVELKDMVEDPKTQMVYVYSPLLHLFLSVYDSASFFDESEVAVIVALLQPMRTETREQSAEYRCDPQNESRLFGMPVFHRPFSMCGKTIDVIRPEMHASTLLCAIRTQSGPSWDRSSPSIVYLHAEHWKTRELSQLQLRTACGQLSHPPYFVIVADNRRVVHTLIATLAKNFPSLVNVPVQFLDSSVHSSWRTLIAEPDVILKCERRHRSCIFAVSTSSTTALQVQALDPYVQGSWWALLAERDMIFHYEAIRQGSIVSALPPPRQHLVQILQYTPTKLGRAFDSANAQPPIPFFVSGRKGIRASDALAKLFYDLHEAERSVGRLSKSEKVMYWLHLIEQAPLSCQFPARRATIGREYLSRQSVAYHVSRAVKKCIDQHGGSWQDPNAGRVTFDELFILEIRQVSEGSWQPVLAVYRY